MALEDDKLTAFRWLAQDFGPIRQNQMHTSTSERPLAP
jgi:hypothetical protein